ASCRVVVATTSHRDAPRGEARAARAGARTRRGRLPRRRVDPHRALWQVRSYTGGSPAGGRRFRCRDLVRRRARPVCNRDRRSTFRTGWPRRMTTPSLALLHAQLRREAFALDRRDTAPPRVGAEVEFMPLEVESRRIAAIDADDRPSTLRALRPIARRLGWCEFVSDKAGVPELRTPHGGRI